MPIAFSIGLSPGLQNRFGVNGQTFGIGLAVVTGTLDLINPQQARAGRQKRTKAPPLTRRPFASPDEGSLKEDASADTSCGKNCS